MSLEFKTIKISHFVDDMKNGGTPRRNVSKYWENGTIPWLKTGEINNSPILDNSEYITEEGLKKSSAKVLPINSVIMALYGKGTAGRVGLLKFEATTNQACCAMICKDRIKSEYLYYYLLSIQPQIELLANGSVQQNLSKEILADYDINVPKNYQDLKNIVWILKNIDQKIENNKSINKNLEQLMKCIFEDWFVNFNYNEDISFKSSELGEIPSNWNVKKLSDVLITLESGKRPKGGISDIEDGIPSIGAENILGLGKFNYSKNKLISHEFFSTLKKGVIQDKDVLLYKDGAQLGRKSLFMKGFPFDICCINEHVFRLQTNDEINQFYLYLWLDQEVMTNEIINLNSNSAQPGINQNDVKSLPILVPELKIISKFNKIISPMMNQIFDNALEINKLTKLRDTLLPKLMSGEIDVSKINCDLE